LNLFRLMTDRLERGQTLDAEDAALLREELERMSRLSARLRDLARVQLSRGEHTPRQLAELALGLAPVIASPVDTSAERASTGLELELAGSDSVTVVCDATLVARALRELFDNALEARRERAGARWERGDAPCLCVWDDGSGFTVEPGQAARFGVTTRAGAAGLGLTLALRVARAHGFRLEFSRTGGLTETRLWFGAPGGGGRGTKGAG
jgi:signal transduction histidine kinase